MAPIDECSLESGVLWCSQSLLPLVFSLILTVASRLLHLYCTNDKTSRLKMKIFSTVRFTELHGEEKREEGDRGDQEKRGNQKGREQSSQ